MTGPKGDKPQGPLPPMHCLLAFEAVARNRQIARAAHELGVTRSALGNAIGMLEHLLRLRLVRRYSPTVELTDAGHRYLAATQAFARGIRDALYAQSPVARTQLRISASRAMGRLWLGPRLADFAQRHPRVELLLTTTDRMDSVLGDGVDVALRYGGETPQGAVSVPLLADRLIAVAGTGLLESRTPPPGGDPLQGLPLIEHPSMRWSAWLASTGSRDVPAAPRVLTTDLHFALHAAVHGVGVAIVPGLFARAFIDDGRLRQVGGHSMPSKTYHAVVSEVQVDRVPMRAFLAWLDQQLSDDRRARGRAGESASH